MVVAAAVEHSGIVYASNELDTCIATHPVELPLYTCLTIAKKYQNHSRVHVI